MVSKNNPIGVFSKWIRKSNYYTNIVTGIAAGLIVFFASTWNLNNSFGVALSELMLIVAVITLIFTIFGLILFVFDNK